MAKEEATTGAGTPRAKGGLKSLVVIALVGVVSAGAGFAMPQLLRGGDAAHVDDAAQASNVSDKQPQDLGLACVPFGEVVANLDDNRMLRYLRAKFTLSVDKKNVQVVQHFVDENKTVLKNWLIGYLQSKQIDEIRGTEGFNRTRREIHQQFNQMLFPNGDQLIKEILFEEFNVQ